MPPRTPRAKGRGSREAVPKERARKKAPATKRATAKSPGPMTPATKKAIARGREATSAVRRYLDALETRQVRPGRRRTPDAMEKRLAEIDVTLPEVTSLSRLLLTQERLTLAQELANGAAAPP